VDSALRTELGVSPHFCTVKVPATYRVPIIWLFKTFPCSGIT
jgi:hypothetical protein